MAGRLPATRYLLTRGPIVIGEYDSLIDIALSLDISVTRSEDTLFIAFMGKQVNPQYTLNWTDYDAIRDWVWYHMQLPSDYKVYRYLTN